MMADLDVRYQQNGICSPGAADLAQKHLMLFFALGFCRPKDASHA
jgi:hypothetical protein